MQLINDTRFYLDGAWVDRPDAPRIAVLNPYSEEVIGHIAAGSAADVDLAVAAARRAFPDFSQTPVAERLALLKRIKALLEERTEEFAQAITAEMGAAITFSRGGQVAFGIAHVNTMIDVLEKFAFQTERDGITIVREPIGVCALITPWNWPLYQITAKVAPAIAAGCTVVLKPSEMSPFTAQMFAQVMHDAGTPPGVFNLVGGTGEVVGNAMSSHPDVDMVTFTGSTRAGVLVAQSAAKTIKRVVQELGGKSPNVFLEDANFEEAVPKGILGAMRNVGQSCAAPTRMVVPASRLAEVEALAASTANDIIVGNPLDEACVIGPLANAPQFAKVQELIQAGIDEGAKLICGGTGLPGGLNHGFFARPTVFSEVTPDMRIAQEEIFGPVVVIMPYLDEADAIRIANDTVYGLSSHVQSADQESARRVARQIRAGQVHINYPAWSGFAPFGGYKQSGNGREYGVFGLEEYLEVKAILGY
ncbi:aldehyde dehydrogenase family protein [Alteraurantiacibacter aestuarii]|uniref:Aldehyde dehydrogenase family protein n=1 Tax=Alteraurantiacibacter aestuarii TaxID=650004 RepID=A0A844ZMH6_9SPHN|nr:aldehyde dehydrogenase family protein [Alteraurantiacibacter aestuarii]MXO88744.1 aldehyde dehydrogenase family protein [Alteraurantiacibacter aestuarii]